MVFQGLVCNLALQSACSQPGFGKIDDLSWMSMAQESKWLKRKLAENAYTFSEHLDASSRYIAAKAPKVLPTSGVAKSSAAISAVFPVC